MTRAFIYARVSTADQTTDNQVREVASAGFSVEPHRVVAEVISGSTTAASRPQFAKLLDRLESGDVLIVTKLDRLGRNAMDVRATVELLAARGVRVHCLALGGVDLTSPAGKMTMQVLNAVAEFERDLIVERTLAGLERVRAEGKTIGRPWAAEAAAVVAWRRETRASISATAKRFGIGISTVKRYCSGSAGPEDAPSETQPA